VKLVILLYIYPSIIGQNCGGDYPFISPVFHKFFNSSEEMKIGDGSDDDSALHFGTKCVERLCSGNVLLQVIGLRNSGSCKHFL
jgi:hypothetical protein